MPLPKWKIKAMKELEAAAENITEPIKLVYRVYIDGFDGDIDVAASCTAGEIIIRGHNGRLTGTMTIVTVYGTQFDATNSNKIQSSIQAVKEVAVTDVGDFKANVAALALETTVSAVGALTTAVKAQTDKLTFNAANIILSDLREVNDAVVTLAELAGLTRAQYIDFFNREVLTRTGAEPKTYKIGTAGNAENVQADYVVIGSANKVDKESVL